MDNIPLPEHEWNFSGINGNEAKLCLIYELSRENYFKHYKHDSGLKKLKYEFEVIQYYAGLENSWIGQFAYPNPKYDHQKPSLKLDPEKFIHWPHVSWIKLKDPKIQSHLKEIKFLRVSDFVKDYSDRLSAWVDFQVSPTKLFIDGAKKTKISNLHIRDQNLSYASFQINWNLTNADLQRKFLSWLKTFRDNEKYPNPDSRGKASPTALLKKLMAYRLLKNRSVLKAEIESGRVLGKPLFETPSEWSFASTQFEAAAKEFSKNFSLLESLQVSVRKKDT